MGRRRQYFVGDVVTLPRRFGGSGNGGVNPALRGEVKVKRPDGSEVVLGEDEKVFTQTDLPGVYSVESGGQVSLFAVNVPAGESRTSVMELEELEKMGVGFEADKVEPTPEMKARQQQASLAVMERQQKLWRWLLVAALGLLLIEIVWAGWLTGRPEDLKETNDD